MKSLKFIFFIALSLIITKMEAQSNEQGWQWAERGGSPSGMGATPFTWLDRERVLDIVVDSDNNYYFLAEVAGYDFTLGGYDYDSGDYEFDTYNDSAGKKDIFMFSTDSEGNYRWSKVIGGGGSDYAASINVDENDNIYISGNALNWGSNTTAPTPVHFDTDSIMGDATHEPSSSNMATFIIKYNQGGDFQWLVQPDGPIAPNGGGGGILKTLIDPNGTIRSLIWLRDGTYLNGQLEVPEGEQQAVIVIYDSAGELQDFIPIDMHPLTGYYHYHYQMAYDAELDRYYIGDTNRENPDPDNPLGIGEYGDENSGFYVAAVDNQGEVLWYNHNNTPIRHGITDLKLDQEGNLYLTGQFSWETTFEPPNPWAGPDTFAGYTFVGNNTGSGINSPYLIKLDSDGDLIWGSNAENYSPYPGQSIVVRGDEVYLGLGMMRDTWGDIVTPGPGGEGLVPDMIILRFDPATGEPQELINDQHTLNPDFVTALTLDNNDDLVVGGSFGNGTTLFDGTDLAIHNNGTDSDFFVAKYGLPALGIEEHQKASLKVYPNPTNNILHIESEQSITSYALYDLQGRTVQEGQLQAAEINMAKVETGIYFLKVIDEQGNVEQVKVVKE